MLKTIKTIEAALILGIVACNPAIPASPKDPREPHFIQASQEDEYVILGPGWHQGKEFPLTQSLKPNNTIKR